MVIAFFSVVSWATLYCYFSSPENYPQHHATLFIQNHNIEDFLLKNIQEQFITELSPFWGQSSGIFIYDVKSASQLGLRNPIPSNNDNKDG